MIRAHGQPGATEQVDIVGGKTVSGGEGSVRRCVVLKEVLMTRVTPVKRVENRIENSIYVSHSVEVTKNEMKLAFPPTADSSPAYLLSPLLRIQLDANRSFVCRLSETGNGYLSESTKLCL